MLLERQAWCITAIDRTEFEESLGLGLGEGSGPVQRTMNGPARPTQLADLHGSITTVLYANQNKWVVLQRSDCLLFPRNLYGESSRSGHNYLTYPPGYVVRLIQHSPDPEQEGVSVRGLGMRGSSLLFDYSYLRMLATYSSV